MDYYVSRLYCWLGVLIICGVLLVGCGGSNIPNIAGSYSGSFTVSGQSGTYPMHIQISQSDQNLTGTTTEGPAVYNDTGTITTSGNFSITETSVNGGTASLSGTIVSSGHLSGTWSSANSGGTWDVTLTK